MPVLGGGPMFTDRRDISEYPSSFGERFDASVGLALEPLRSGTYERIADPLLYEVRNRLERVAGDRAREEAKARGVDAEIEPGSDIGRYELDGIIAAKLREKKRDAAFARSPGGLGALATEILGGVIGSAMDPVQGAASFIPVVGQAKYAMMLERAGASALGRAAVRVGVGAVEGAAGAAVLEPLNLLTAYRNQTRYGATDSFVNIVAGGVLGAGLHTIGGAVGDAVTGARRRAALASETRSRAALAGSVTALEDGRPLDVSPVFRESGPGISPELDEAFLAREFGRAPDVADSDVARALDDIRAVRAGVVERPADLVDTIKSMGGIRLIDAEGRVTPEGGDVRDIFNSRYPIGLVNNRRGKPLDYIREALQEQGWLPRAPDGAPDQTTTSDVLDLLARWNGGDRPRHPDTGIVEDLGPTKAEIEAAGITKADGDDVAAFKLAQHRVARAIEDAGFDIVREPVVMPDTYDPVSGYEPPDVGAVRADAERAVLRQRTSEDYGVELDDETAIYTEMIDAARARGTLTERDAAALALADEFEARTAVTARAYKAAAACVLGVA